jgi:hypothetical protein
MVVIRVGSDPAVSCSCTRRTPGGRGVHCEGSYRMHIDLGNLDTHRKGSRGHSVDPVGDQVVVRYSSIAVLYHPIPTNLTTCDQSSFCLLPAPALVPLLALSLSVEAYANEALLLMPGRLFSEP